MNPSEIPWATLSTVFLDVGNTLVSMDFRWIRDELRVRGLDVELERLQRAEAAARPIVSAALESGGSTETGGAFRLYMCALLDRLEEAAALEPASRAALADEVIGVLRGDKRERLWTWVLPGVPEALDTLGAMGLRRIVVSNSDGSVERVLTGLGLRTKLEAVLDSAVVGFEKPDVRLFERALEVAGAAPDETVHLGDLAAVDVLGARAAGVHAVLVDPYDDWQDEDGMRVRDLSELVEYIRAARVE